MVKKLFATPNDAALTLIRLILGVIFFAHGSQKALGWFGGFGFHATMQMFTTKMGIPAIFAVLAILAEFLGGLGLLVGFLTRIAAFGISIVMLVAIFKVHLPHGLIGAGGFEYPLALLAMALMILIKGAGAFSIDRAIGKE